MDAVSGAGQGRSREAQSLCYGRERRGDVVGFQDADSQSAARCGFARGPWSGQRGHDVWIPFPRPSRLHDVEEEFAVADAARNGARACGEAEATHPRCGAHGLPAEGDAPVARVEAVQPVTRRRDADATADVGADAKGAAAHGEEGAFAATGAAGGQLSVQRVEDAAEDVVGAVEGHEGLGDIGLAMDDCAGGEEEGGERGGGGGGVEAEGGEADAGVDTGEVEGVF